MTKRGLQNITGIITALALAACGGVPKGAPEVRTVEVKVPVAVPCDPKVSPEPDWTEVERQLHSPEAAEMLRGAYAGYKMARAYIREQATGLKACATVTPPAP